MFEFAKLLFLLAVVIAAAMVPKGVKQLREEIALSKGDTTAIQHRRFAEERELERVRVRIDSALQSIVKGN